MPRPQHLALRLRTEHHDQRLRHRILALPPPAGLGQPHLHTGPLEQRRHRCELVVGERPLVLADHHCVEPSLRRGQLGQQRSSLRAGGPRQPPRTALVEELDLHRPVTSNQTVNSLALPCP
jgi:hypothetical protein